MRFMLTAIEKLDGGYPGLQGDIDELFARGVTATGVKSFLETKHGISVPLRWIWKYRHKRWVPRVQRIKREAEYAEAILGIVAKTIGRLPRAKRKLSHRDRARVVSAVARQLLGDGGD